MTDPKRNRGAKEGGFKTFCIEVYNDQHVSRIVEEPSTLLEQNITMLSSSGRAAAEPVPHGGVLQEKYR